MKEGDTNKKDTESEKNIYRAPYKKYLSEGFNSFINDKIAEFEMNNKEGNFNMIKSILSKIKTAESCQQGF